MSRNSESKGTHLVFRDGSPTLLTQHSGSRYNAS